MYVRFMTGRAPTPRTTFPPAGEPADTREQLDEAARMLGSAGRAMATVVATLAELDHAEVIAEEGQTLRSWLRTVAGCTGGDERALLLAVQRLAHLPTVRRWLADGTVSWAVTRSIVFETRRLTVAQLEWLDDTLASDADRLGRLDADGVVSVVERLAADARPDLEADRERRQSSAATPRCRPASTARCSYMPSSTRRWARRYSKRSSPRRSTRRRQEATRTSSDVASSTVGPSAPAPARPLLLVLTDVWRSWPVPERHHGWSTPPSCCGAPPCTPTPR